MAQPAYKEEKISLEEAIRLASVDQDFYGRFFFPHACRQPSPQFHKEMWGLLLSTFRYISFMLFRGGAKTTITRLYLSFIIAFGFARTILVVGKSEEAASRTLGWLKRNVQFNSKWANAFGLRKGEKWSETEIEIWHGADEVPIRVIALGITGSTRGINVDDYRPDLIVVDDPCDEENTSTPEQRKKTAELLFGALVNSLAPASEAPMAKLVLLQTPFNEDDLIHLTVKDPQWKNVVYGCFDATGQSRWAARWSTEELQADKQSYIERNMLPLWLREMECKIVDDATSAFPSSFMRYWEVLPEAGKTIMAIDPTPPPREGSLQEKSGDLDDAAIVVLRHYRDTIYVCQVYATKSPDPDELYSMIFALARTWRCREIYVETVLFARTIATGLRKEMLARRQWLTIHTVEEKRKKSTRIREDISGVYTAGALLFHESQGDIIEQLTSYPAVNHDDLIDALSIGVNALSVWITLGDDDEAIEGEVLSAEEEEYEEQESAWRQAP